MGHVGHKGTLLQSRLIGTLGLFLQALLFLNQVGHVTHDTIDTQHLPVLVEIGHTVNEVPLILVALMEQWTHMHQISSGYFEVLSVSQLLPQITVLQHLCQFCNADHILRLTHPFIEGDVLVCQRHSEETHVTRLHQILQFSLITLDILVGPSQFYLVSSVLQIELTLLGDVTNREGDIHQLLIVVIDGVYAQFRVTVHTALHNHTLGTEVEFLCLSVVQHIAEGRQVVEGAVKVVGVVLRLELQDLPHLLVGIEQHTVLVIEGQSGNALFKELAIALCQVLLLLFLEGLLGLVGQGTEEVHGNLLITGIFGDTHIVHIAPDASVRFGTQIPAEGTFGGFGTIHQTAQEIHIYLLVFRMDIVQALLVAHALLRQEVTVHVHAIVLLQGEAHHVVVTATERTLHDGREVFRTF